MRGIILAGGTGKRLHPLTIAVSKQLLPVYDRPMIHYPLMTLVKAGIKDILIITTPEDQHLFKRLLGEGKDWGVSLSYEIQDKPNGIAEAFLIGEKFIEGSSVALILGDNLFLGPGFSVEFAKNFQDGAKVFSIETDSPQKYGVIELDGRGQAVSIEEKPSSPKTNFAISGLYILDGQVSEIAKKITPSKRGELEIVDVLEHYLAQNKLKVKKLGKNVSWLDLGTADSLLEASNAVKKLKSDGFNFFG